MIRQEYAMCIVKCFVFFLDQDVFDAHQPIEDDKENNHTQKGMFFVIFLMYNTILDKRDLHCNSFGRIPTCKSKECHFCLVIYICK